MTSLDKYWNSHYKEYEQNTKRILKGLAFQKYSKQFEINFSIDEIIKYLDKL